MLEKHLNKKIKKLESNIIHPTIDINELAYSNLKKLK